jgi:hypothetical protein
LKFGFVTILTPHVAVAVGVTVVAVVEVVCVAVTSTMAVTTAVLVTVSVLVIVISTMVGTVFIRDKVNVTVKPPVTS